MSTQEPALTPAELRPLEVQIEGMLRHENDLLNHRIQWFLTINGFLFTAVAIFGNTPGRPWFGTIVGVVGLLTSISFYFALSIGRKGWTILVDRWNIIRARCTEPYTDIGVYGYRTRGLERYLMPWILLPWILSIGWLGVIVFVWAVPPSPTSAFTPVVVEPGKQEVRVYDSRTGQLQP
jgi:hypothetical protein